MKDSHQCTDFFTRSAVNRRNRIKSLSPSTTTTFIKIITTVLSIYLLILFLFYTPPPTRPPPPPLSKWNCTSRNLSSLPKFWLTARLRTGISSVMLARLFLTYSEMVGIIYNYSSCHFALCCGAEPNCLLY
jgi:hypothetical protein